MLNLAKNALDQATAIGDPIAIGQACEIYKACRGLAIAVEILSGRSGRIPDYPLDNLIIQLADIYAAAGGTPSGRRSNTANKTPASAPFVRFIMECLVLATQTRLPEQDWVERRIRRLREDKRIASAQ